MKPTLPRNLSRCTRNLFLSTKTLAPNPDPLSLSRSTRYRPRFYSSEYDSSSDSKLAQNQSKNVSVDVEDVSKEELKKRIDKYFEGDLEAIPSIFEAILTRKLSGKHEDSDDELMKEIKSKHGEPVDDVEDENLESDFDELYSTDEESD